MSDRLRRWSIADFFSSGYSRPNFPISFCLCGCFLAEISDGIAEIISRGSRWDNLGISLPCEGEATERTMYVYFAVLSIKWRKKKHGDRIGISEEERFETELTESIHCWQKHACKLEFGLWGRNAIDYKVDFFFPQFGLTDHKFYIRIWSGLNHLITCFSTIISMELIWNWGYSQLIKFRPIIIQFPCNSMISLYEVFYLFLFKSKNYWVFPIRVRTWLAH